MNNFCVVKYKDEYRVHTAVIDSDGTVLDVSQSPLDIVGFSLEDLQTTLEAMYYDIVENPHTLLDYDEDYDESQFEFDRFMPVDEAFR